MHHFQLKEHKIYMSICAATQALAHTLTHPHSYMHTDVTIITTNKLTAAITAAFGLLINSLSFCLCMPFYPKSKLILTRTNIRVIPFM